MRLQIQKYFYFCNVCFKYLTSHVDANVMLIKNRHSYSNNILIEVYQYPICLNRPNRCRLHNRMQSRRVHPCHRSQPTKGPLSLACLILQPIRVIRRIRPSSTSTRIPTSLRIQKTTRSPTMMIVWIRRIRGKAKGSSATS